MKYSLVILLLIAICTKVQGQIDIEIVGTLPEPVANNAVCEGFVNDTNYLYSFGGIDETKIYSGIHSRCFRYNIETGIAERIADLPDDRAKIASWASRIGDIIYIAGGYYVSSNGSEESSKKMHRYDIVNNEFLEDGADIPRAIDDQVQVVWRDSLIYLVTGWSNNGNVTNVQIYNPSEDSWVTGTALPNSNDYRSFGASGSIVGDTIYYFGGAGSIGGFNVQNDIRKGVINSSNPTEIEWSLIETQETKVGYRMASTSRANKIYWIGGSEVTYNFNGIAYNGSGGVPLSNRILELDADSLQWNEYSFEEVPMDLRGHADVSENEKYLAGGMRFDQEVTDKIYRITFTNDISATKDNFFQKQIKVFPNPFQENILIEHIGGEDTSVNIYTAEGKCVYSKLLVNQKSEIELNFLNSGLYILSITNGKAIAKSLLYKL